MTGRHTVIQQTLNWAHHVPSNTLSKGMQAYLPWEISRCSGRNKVNRQLYCSAISGEEETSTGRRKRSEEGHLTRIQERRGSRSVCPLEVTPKTLSHEERRGIRSGEMGGEALGGGRNGLCKRGA